MKKRQITRYLIAAVVAGGALLGASACHAQAYTVSLDTSLLKGLGNFFVEFQLTDGSAAGGNANSQAVVSNFSLTGGALGSALPALGNTAGSLTTGLTLVDGPAASGPVADFAQAFSVSSGTSLLRFDVNLSATGVDAPTPDKFSFLILDSAQNSLSTNGPTGAEFVSADFTTTAPTPAGYSSVGTIGLTAVVRPAQQPGGGGGVIPEPGTCTLLATSLLPLIGIVARRRIVKP